MAAEVGQFALILALVLAMVQALATLWGAHRGEPVLMALGRAAATLQAGFVILAFGCLAASYIACDFSVALVAQHSNSQQPLAYRFAATWGSHEGSMLLWVLILGIYGGAVARFGGTLRETLQARVLGVQGLIGVAFLGFLIFTSNPFLRLSPAPAEGVELNPLLQDPGLVSHPPLLYLGYVGFSVAFAFAVAALIEGRVDAAWARWVRPWVLAAWVPLTAGITLGSLWAYYELGWGGWWFWDPVENASLMPWLLGTALLHSALVLERRGALVSWTILLSILTFSLSLVGTFLVRSGILTSVHSFAVDPQRGVYILGIITVTTGAALGLYAWRAPSLRTGALFTPLSREGGITLNNVFLVALAATVFLGTFSPVFIEILGKDKISVGPPYYARTFAPLAIPLLALVVFGPMLNWKRDNLAAVLKRVRVPAGLALAAVLVGLITVGWKAVVSAASLRHSRPPLVGWAGESAAVDPHHPAGGVGPHPGACGPGPAAARDHRRHRLAQRQGADHAPRREHGLRRPHAHPAVDQSGRRPQLPGPSGAVRHHRPWWPLHHGRRAPRLCLEPDHRGGDPCEPAWQPLHLWWR
jgi:cytochrome c-type biogenesis protein CcmF